MQRWALLGLTGLAALTVGCGNATEDPVQDFLGDPPSQLDEIQAAILTPTCARSGCHSGASAPFGLDLTAGAAWRNLYNVPSAEVPAFDRIEPGNAADSYLFMKITNDPRIQGDPMPAFMAPLSSQEIALIETWINDGANP